MPSNVVAARTIASGYSMHFLLKKITSFPAEESRMHKTGEEKHVGLEVEVEVESLEELARRLAPALTSP